MRESVVVPQPFEKVGEPWCRRAGLNCRPQPYQGCALPLSYGGDEEGAYSEENRERQAQNRLDRRTLSPHPRDMPISDDKSTREARLAQALRTNLRKRKAPSRKGSDENDAALEAARSAPRPYEVVRRLLGITHRGGERVALTAEMSAPFPVPDSDDWAVAVRLVGDGGPFDTEAGKAAFGRDGLAATRKAIDLVQVAIDLASTTHDLRWPDDETPYDLSAPI
jgi:hypothetical protein